MERPDVTYTNPGRRDQRYIGKENGKSKFVPIHYLLWTLRDLLDMINGCSLVAQEKFDSFEDFQDFQQNTLEDCMNSFCESCLV